MSKKDSNIKIPFIVKDILADNSIKISSVFTSDKEIISFERLKYLIDTEQIELLNAYIDKDHVVFTTDFKYIKKNKKVVSKILYQKINSYDVLTNTQKEFSKIFNGTAFELDVENSNQYGINSTIYYNAIYSKPLKITPTDTITVRIHPNVFSDSGEATVYFSWTNTEIVIRDVTSEQLNKLTNLFKNPSSLTDIDFLCSEILKEYIANGLDWTTIDTSTTLEDIKNRCDKYGIYEEYHSMLQNRINITKSHSDLIKQLIQVIKVEYDTNLLSVESLILYFALYCVGNSIPTDVSRSIEWEIEKIANPYDKNKRKERAIEFCASANKYSNFKEILTKYEVELP